MFWSLFLDSSSCCLVFAPFDDLVFRSLEPLDGLNAERRSIVVPRLAVVTLTCLIVPQGHCKTVMAVAPVIHQAAHGYSIE